MEKTFSLSLVVKELEQRDELRELGAIGFMLTVIRDNTACDDTYRLLNLMLDKLPQED